ncbi:MAG: cold shock domain-containing protein [Deltaproteobacteria bacterium]|nr:cold shock domain-containing protein [Deltaproteobacteria bacterium]
MMTVRALVPNTIPVPPVALRTQAPLAPATAVVSRDDQFSKGKVVKFFPNLSYGFVRDHIGRELFFHLDEVDFLGPKGHRRHVQVGLDVGFDCCRTSHGLRVKRMKIY